MQFNNRLSLNNYALLSLGKHPLSGRPNRAEEDAQAFELGAKLGDCLGIHAGMPENAEQLTHFLGMNIGSVALLDIEKNADPIHALTQYFKEIPFDIILTGSRSETGESSGMLPYMLAKALNIPVINQVCDVVMNPSRRQSSNMNYTMPPNKSICVIQALPRGARRKVSVNLPCLLIIDAKAPPARQSAFGPANRGQIRHIKGVSHIDKIATGFTFTPAQKKAKRLKTIKAKSAAERFKAATASQTKSGKVITPTTAEQGAQAILKLLQEEDLL